MICSWSLLLISPVPIQRPFPPCWKVVHRMVKCECAVSVSVSLPEKVNECMLCPPSHDVNFLSNFTRKEMKNSIHPHALCDTLETVFISPLLVEKAGNCKGVR